MYLNVVYLKSLRDMCAQYFLGVDIGTAGTKAALFDLEGKQLSVAYEESKLYFPRVGWVEQEPEDFYSSAINTIKRVIETARTDPRDVASIAFSGQMAGILAVDRDWKPVMPYDSWLDIRSRDYINYLKKNFEDLLIRTTGSPPTVNHLPKMMWWQNERPDVFSRICKFTVPAVYVAGKLAGLKGEDAFYDYTYITFTGLFDVHKMDWSEELAAAFKIPLDKMPKIVEPWQIIGELTSEEARKTGLVKGIPIVAGAGDGMACVFGAGLTRPGLCLDIAGTASAFYVSTDKVVPDTKYKTLLYLKSVVPDLWSVGAYINGGGLCLRWFRDEIAVETKKRAQEKGLDAYKLLDAEAATITPGSEGVLFIPHMGGRAYPYNPKLRGTWIGLTWRHTLAHLYRSILEAVAYEYNHYLRIINESFSGIQFDEVRGIGGGSKSDVWNKIKADVLGIPYSLLNREEYAVTALAVIGGYGVGAIKDLVGEINKWIRPVRKFYPDAETHSLYKKYADFYEKLLSLLDNLYEGQELLLGES
jgi:xylulokinase